MPVGVVVPSYNHAAFIEDAVRSVLVQTHAVSEVVVVDDGSSDDSVLRLERISDPRLRIIRNTRNYGGAESLNIGIQALGTPLISICNSDDLWEPNKIEFQLQAMERSGAAAIFSDVSWIGAWSDAERDFPHASSFRVRNRSRHDWLNRLVTGGNCLCHPSILVKRDVYDRVGLYDNRYRQLPDFEMWLRLFQHFDAEVLDEKLVRFRVHDNTSTPSPANSSRDMNERHQITLELFDRLSADDLHRAFGCRRHPSEPQFDIAVERVLCLLNLVSPFSELFETCGRHLAMQLLRTEEGRLAWTRYGLNLHDLHSLNGLRSPWVPASGERLLTGAERIAAQRIARYRTLAPNGGSVEPKISATAAEAALKVAPNEAPPPPPERPRTWKRRTRRLLRKLTSLW